MRSWVKTALAALAALTLATVPAAAQVPDPYARELAERLAHTETVLVDQGYARAAGPFASGVRAREQRRFNVTLRAGYNYSIVGVCESRCRDLDMRLYDVNNRLIAQDVLEDSVPIIHIRPAVTGRYDIEIEMMGCTSAPCWFAFNVYSR